MTALIVYLKLLIAVLLVWPRGYLLIYLIDRSKSFSFGFKFFVGWLLGLCTFAADVFSANYLGGMKLDWWVIYSSALMQIFGFSFVIFIFERKILWPRLSNFMPFVQRQIAGFVSLKKAEKIVLGVLLLIVLTGLIKGGWLASTPADAWNQKAATIYSARAIDLSANDPYYSGVVKYYPLNDTIIKFWLAAVAGGFSQNVISFAANFYYLALVIIFFLCLPSKIKILDRLLATGLAAFIPIWYYNSSLAFEDTLFAIWLLLAFTSMMRFLGGDKKSTFYFAEMALAVAVWTKNEALYVVFPIILITTVLLYLYKKVKWYDLIMCWFWAGLTISPWFLLLVFNWQTMLLTWHWQIGVENLWPARLILYLSPVIISLVFSDFLLKLKHGKK